jgi:hypothetical protein
MLLVGWYDDERKIQYCGVQKLDPQAWSDHTICDHYVTLRVDSKRGRPTCPDCLKELAKTRKKRAA